MSKASKDIVSGSGPSRREFLVEVAGLALGAATVHTSLRAAQGERIELVREGRSPYSIVLGRKASLSEQRGAHELQHFLQEMSGAQLPILTGSAPAAGANAVFVGQSEALDALEPGIPFASLGGEGFALKTLGSNLAIAGGRERGTMYGVSTFLEKLGCRWFTEDVSRTPRETTITVPAMDEIQRPAFEYREPFVGEAMGRDWGARNKVNGGMQTHLDASTGGSVKYFPFVHSFYKIIPPEQYFAAHPEYFAQIDGKRVDRNAQLCLTNAALLRVVTETVLGWIKDHPEAEIFSVSQNDCNGWCECDNCQKVVEEEGAISGVLLRFVNAVAEKVAERYPHKLIDTIAYQMSEKPPHKVHPVPNVRVRLCPIGNCQGHPFETCPQNLQFMENLRGWAAMTRQLYIWHYTTNFSNFVLPFPDFEEITVDAGMYHRHGVVGIFYEDDVNGGGSGQTSALRSYIMARLLWNPATDVEQDVKEFHETFYGRAAQPMLDYHNFMQRKVSFPPNGEGQHITYRRSPDFSSEDFQKLREIFQHAEQLADDEAIRHRVGKARLSLDYAELLASRRFVASRGEYAPVDLAGLRQRFDRMMVDVRRFGNVRLHEHQTNEGDEQEFAVHMKAYPLEQIENDDLRAHVVPALSGRIVGLIEKSSGRNVLRHFAPEELADQSALWNPNYGGIALLAYGDFMGQAPMDVEWSVAPGAAEQRTCRLIGETEAGLRLEQTWELDSAGASLRSHTRAINNGSKPVTLTLNSRLEPNPVDRNAAMEFNIRFRAVNGKEIVHRFSSLTQEYQGSARYQGEEVPAGEWRLRHSLLALDFTTRFEPSQVDRCTASWSACGRNWMTLGVWSKKRTLAPGDKMEFSVAYHIQAS
jgi:Domain of unknown function (DUF4838)/Glycosyl hydrolase family 67 N-terminus